jgi:hypothetical protein
LAALCGRRSASLTLPRLGFPCFSDDTR